MSHKPTINCLISSLTIFCVLFWLPVAGQYDFSSVTQQLQRSQKQLGNNVITLVYKDDSLIYKKEIGEDFTAKIAAPVATAGQWLAVATIMTFVDQGKLKLDDPVADYLPIFSKYAKVISQSGIVCPIPRV